MKFVTKSSHYCGFDRSATPIGTQAMVDSFERYHGLRWLQVNGKERGRPVEEGRRRGWPREKMPRHVMQILGKGSKTEM